MKQQPKPAGRPKGSPKTGGRKKGTPNKTTDQKHEFIDALVEHELEHIYERLDELDTKDRLLFLVHFMPYYVGKMVPYAPKGLENVTVTMNLNNADAA